MEKLFSKSRIYYDNKYAMKKPASKIKKFILDILFPKFCLNCKREGTYLCEDCFYLIDILKRQYCPFCPKIVFDGRTCNSCKKGKSLNGLYCAAPYDDFIVKKLINQFKYKPHIKELSKPLTSLIIAHFLNLNIPLKPIFDNSVLIPIPLHKRKIKEQGFNQAEEIGKEFSKFLTAPVLNNVLIKVKQTLLQAESKEKNIKEAFLCKKPELVKGKRVFLIDDVFITGTTMEECAKALKEAGVEEVWGIVVARG